jgi:hypothetical protein
MNLKDFGSKSTPNDLNWIANIGKGCQCLTEIGLSLDKLHYLGIVNFKHKYV